MKSATQGGFTLIEVMMAVALVAILSAIAVQLYVGYIEEAKLGTAAKDIRQAEIILDDLAADNALNAIDGGLTSVRGIYLANGGLQLGAPATTPAGTTPWLDPWDRIYRYQRNGADGVMRDAAGDVSNDASNSSLPQSYDIFSLGDDGTAGTADDVVRGCNGRFIGLRGDHPSC
jgi:prepilin-type N-terminal cleavage/methylation domain-containing protein